jgi:hypothetical protein
MSRLSSSLLGFQGQSDGEGIGTIRDCAATSARHRRHWRTPLTSAGDGRCHEFAAPHLPRSKRPMSSRCRQYRPLFDEWFSIAFYSRAINERTVEFATSPRHRRRCRADAFDICRCRGACFESNHETVHRNNPTSWLASSMLRLADDENACLGIRLASRSPSLALGHLTLGTGMPPAASSPRPKQGWGTGGTSAKVERAPSARMELAGEHPK